MRLATPPRKPDAKIVTSIERFVADMVTLQLKAIDEFKQFYRSVDALLIEDVHFSGKDAAGRSFPTYNLLGGVSR